MKSATLEELLRHRDGKSPVVLATNLNTGEERLVRPGDLGGDGLDPAVAAAAADAFRSDRSGTVETGDGPVFVHVFNPPLRMIVVGAVHIAQPLARMAALADYDVTVVDPRAAFATDERFPDVTLLTDWPDDALTALAPDARTAVVTQPTTPSSTIRRSRRRSGRRPSTSDRWAASEPTRRACNGCGKRASATTTSTGSTAPWASRSAPARRRRSPSPSSRR